MTRTLPFGVQLSMSRGRSIGGHTKPVTGISDDWITPQWVVEPLGHFDLDPCASPTQPWPIAADAYTLPDQDGLDLDWYGRVWLNPPYGAETGTWLAKLADHGAGTALIFARTETRMFHRFVWQRAQAIFFFSNRLYFHRPDGTRASGNAGGPSCLVAYGFDDAAWLKQARYPGALVTDWSW